MKREEDYLREACAKLAEEEAAQFEKFLTRKASQEAESLYRRHRRRALAIIRQGGKSSGRGLTIALRAAACLVLIGGAVWLSFFHTSKEPTPLTMPDLTPSIAPFFTPVSATETPAPIAVTPEPTGTLSPTPTPTLTPAATSEASDAEEATEAVVVAVFPTSFPSIGPEQTVRVRLVSVITPEPTPEPTPMPTPEPTTAPTILPTAVPVPTPELTILPTAVPVPSAYESARQLWTGHYFPRLVEGWSLADIEQDGESHSLRLTDGSAVNAVFTEYADSRLLELPMGAATYLELQPGVIALRIQEGDQVFLAWNVEGQTLTLQGGQALADAAAAYIEKISSEPAEK